MPICSLLRLRRFWLWVLLLGGLGAGLCFVPLFNLLGYEFCLALALASSAAALHLGSLQVALSRRLDLGMLLSLQGPGAALAGLLARVAAGNLLLLVLPGTVLLALVSSIIPARRAARLLVTDALRYE